MNSIVTDSPVRVFDPEAVRADFPILHQDVNGHPLVYLDNAATTQKPQSVIDALVHYYSNDNSNVHRGAHALADRATARFEEARTKVASFIGSKHRENVIWTSGTTEGINLVASSWCEPQLKPGDKILVSTLEHHSNIVPWQMVASKTGADVVPIPLTEEGDIDLEMLSSILDASVKLVAVNHVSNALGTINPVEEIVRLSHSVGAKVLIDGAQSVAHFPVDVEHLGCDFYVFSGHKLFGPTGIGVLWGKIELLEAMSPYQGGGEMIESVSFSGTTYNTLPYKFEAGTPNIAGAIGLAAAMDYILQFDRATLLAHENNLLHYCLEVSRNTPGLKRVGQPRHSASVFSFLIDGTHPADVGTLLDQQGVAVRTGHHCAQPLMDAWQIPGTIRASFSIYNTCDDIDRLFAALDKALVFLR